MDTQTDKGGKALDRPFIHGGLLVRLAVLALLCLAAFAPGARAATGSIAGTVTDAPTGEPIEGAEVCAEAIEEESNGACGYTETDGTYFIGGLSAGEYRVWFWGSNQYEFEYFDGKKNWDEADPVEVPSGGQATDIDADMDRTATISGTVLATADGLGVEEVEACAYPLDPAEETFSQCGYSDADGTYKIKGLVAGNYKVEFWAGFTGRDLAWQFYDHKPRYQDADVVSVAEGEWLEGIDADLFPGASIEGHVSSLATGLPLEARVCSIEAASGRLITCTWTDEGGAYRLRSLPEGSYKVVFSPELWEFLPDEALPGEEDDGFPTQFWNGQTTIAAANVLALATGGSATGVDARLGLSPAPPAATAPPARPPIRKHRKCRRGYRKKLVRGKRRCVKVHRHRRHRHQKRASRPTVRFSAR